MNPTWLRDDALILRDQGRLYGCLTLLLCLVDALAVRKQPGTANNRSRYCGYLKARLKDLGYDSSYRIEEKNDIVDLSEIIYTYFRCQLIHEGNSREDELYEVQLRCQPNPRSVYGAGILIDRQKKQFIVQVEWLIDLLLSVCEEDCNS